MFSLLDRSLVYRHRSLRVLQIRPVFVIFSTLFAVACSIGFLRSANVILAAHESFCLWILRLVQIPIGGSAEMEVFPAFARITIPVINVPSLALNSMAVIWTATPVFAILLLVHRKYPLARSLLFFVMALILAALMIMVLRPNFTISSTDFTLLWLRTQVVLWFLIPWLGAVLFLPVEPSFARGVAWILLMWIFGYGWSALRLAFNLGMLHSTGVVFATTLWFALGPLADLLYILVFYSLVVRKASRSRWGPRICAL